MMQPLPHIGMTVTAGPFFTSYPDRRQPSDPITLLMLSEFGRHGALARS